MKKSELTSIIEQKPSEPGVYIFRDADGIPIYVGKAVDIRDRLRSYRDPRTAQIGKMIEKAEGIDHRLTEDEKEALLLEANLIKKFQPKYNIRLKDSKSYPVIEITSDRFPAIKATRDPDEDGTVFGPFTEMGRVENSIKAIRDMYGLVSPKCKRRERPGDPCLDYEIGLCSAPYAGKIEEKEYEQRVEKAEKFFRDDPVELIGEIRNEMVTASEEKRFERASTLRDYVRDLEYISGNRRIERDIGTKHVLAVNEALDRVGLVILEENTIQEKDIYRLTEHGEDRRSALEAFVKQFYAADSLPEKIVLEQDIEDAEIVSWLEDEGVEFGAPEDGRERVLMESAQDTASREENSQMEELGDILGFDIERIECFDVSHTGGKEVVGSNVVFEYDKPKRSDYRRKKLSEQNDDYENMYQLVKWRSKRQIEGRDERPEPDLVLIDGGEGQLKAAVRAMNEAGWSIPVFAIVKPDDKILGLHRNPEISDDIRQILSSIRDEAHRFAVDYHKSRRDSVDSKLEEIDGLGPEKRKELLTEFSIHELEKASADDIQKVEGIGEELSERISLYLKEDV